MSDFKQAAKLSTTQILAAVIRKFATANPALTYDELAEGFALRPTDIKTIVMNRAGTYHDPSYVPSRLRPGSTTQEEGWVIPKSAWFFHRELYRQYKITLQFGDYAAIRRQTESSEPDLIDYHPNGGRIHAVKLPDLRAAAIFVVITNSGQLVKALPPNSYIRKNGAWQENPMRQHQRPKSKRSGFRPK
jgi:hypothetical protein